MYLCLCRGLKEKDLRPFLKQGRPLKIEEIKRRLGLGADCGACLEQAITLIDQKEHSKGK